MVQYAEMKVAKRGMVCNVARQNGRWSWVYMLMLKIWASMWRIRMSMLTTSVAHLVFRATIHCSSLACRRSLEHVCGRGR